MDYAPLIAREWVRRIEQACTRTARGTVTEVSPGGLVTFTDATGATRKGAWVDNPPAVGEVISYLNDGSGIPLIMGTAGKAAAWTTYTPTWTSGGTQPTAGNSTIVGAYRRVGNTLHFRGQISVGTSGVVLGTGELRMSLPSGMAGIAAQYQVGSAQWFVFSTGTVYPGVCFVDPSATYTTFQVEAVALRSQSDALAVNDSIAWTACVEVQS